MSGQFIMCLVQQNKEKLLKRAKRKFLAQPVINHLIALDSPLKHKYESTLACSSNISVANGKITSRYCKRTWCSICAPIRTAVRINNYRDQLEAIGDLCLTTLTLPNCPASEIPSSIRKFRAVFKQFRNSYNKRNGTKFRGVYNFEITYSGRLALYHPHIHIIHECIPMEEKKDNEHSGKYRYDENSEEISEYKNELTEYWLTKCPEASAKAQDTRLCYDLIEGFKYQSLSIYKIKHNGQKESIIPVRELDTIYQAIQGIRCFQPFGIRKIPEQEEEQQMEELAAYSTDQPEGQYYWKANDWVKHRTVVLGDDFIHDETFLTGFEPTKKLLLYYDKLKANKFYEPDKTKLN